MAKESFKECHNPAQIANKCFWVCFFVFFLLLENETWRKKRGAETKHNETRTWRTDMWLPLVFCPQFFRLCLFKQRDVDQSLCVSEKWRANGQRGVEWVGDNRVWQVNYSWRPWHEIAAKKKTRQRDNTLRWESGEKVAGMRAFEWKVKGQRKEKP